MDEDRGISSPTSEAERASSVATITVMAEVSDEVLLDFDRDRLADRDGERAHRLLVEQPELYDNHLAIARGLYGAPTD